MISLFAAGNALQAYAVGRTRDAVRELAEEADLRAEDWEELLTFTPSPGSLGERITLFLATGLSDVAEDERHEREHQERAPFPFTVMNPQKTR